MFVIVYNNQVILGPMPWRKFFFENIIEEDCEVQVTLPQKNDVPYTVNDEIVILPARYTHEEHNPITQKHNGPFWTITETEAVGNFVAIDKDVEHLKSELKQIVADKRWKKEVGGIKVTINDIEYSVDTSREGRKIYIEQLQMNSSSYDWKFNEGYVTLSLVDLQNIVQSINEHIQNCFAEERNRINLIDSKTSLEDLELLHNEFNPRVTLNGIQ
jgi:hypothetical protein